MNKYDVAAIIWPAYTGDEPRTRIFWPEGYGEWQTVKAMQPRFEGHTWPRKPLWGYVNEADPYVMEMEINAAADHGVNVFIYDWYWYDNRPFLENCLNDGFLKAKNRDRMKFYLMWANHSAGHMWDKRNSHIQGTDIWDGAVDRKTFEHIVDRTIEKYFTQPNYYKIDGKPVYWFFNIDNLVRGLGGVDGVRSALQYFRERTVQAGFPGLELHMNLRGQKGIRKPLDENTDFLTFVNENFDGCTHYGIRGFASLPDTYPNVLEQIKNEWAFIDENVKIPYYPQISMGWDANPRYNGLDDFICYDNTPENIKKGFELAKAYVDSHKGLRAPLITVNAWNEWTETSYLQPDDINGYGYLEALRDVFLGKPE